MKRAAVCPGLRMVCTLRRRAACAAFHPDAPQAILDFGPSIFALERTLSLDGNQVVLCLFNFQGEESQVPDGCQLTERFPPREGKGFDYRRRNDSGGRTVFSPTLSIPLAVRSLNLLLIDQKVSHLSLPREDPRAVHLRSVLGVKVGDEIDLALRNGPRGKGTVSVLSEKRLDLVIRWLAPHPCDFFPVHLVVGFARPQTCRKNS